MKKVLLSFLAFSAICISGISQTTATSPSFGIRAGVNFQNLNGKDADGDKLENKLLLGFNIGATVDIPIAPDFYVQPGLLFTTKGAKMEDGDDVKAKISYLEVPINLLYKPMLGQGNLIMGFGPYFAFAMGGKIKSNAGDVDIEFDNEVGPGETTPHLKRFDAGANLLFGYQFTPQISAQLNAQLGLVNIGPKVTGVDSDATLKNTGFGISVGYHF